MSLASLTYTPPIRKVRPQRSPDFALFEEAVEAAEQGQRLPSLQKTLAHLFPDLTIPDLTKEPFTFIQGSSRVTVRIDEDQLSAVVPLVRLPSGGSAIAALRYVLSTISATGQLYQPRLRGEDIYLEYRDTLARQHPAKLVEVLRRMPMEADDCDDWLIGQFGAQPLERAEIRPLSESELQTATKFWRAHWSEIEELSKEAQKKRSVFFLNDVTAYAIFKPRFVLPLSGFLAARMRESANTFNDGNEDPSKRGAALSKFAKEMKAVDAAELAKSLGHADYAISPFGEGTPAVITGYFGENDYMSKVEGLRKSGHSQEAAFSLATAYYYLLARHMWAEDIEAAMCADVSEAASKPWREAATFLFERARKLVEDYGGDEEEESDDEDDEGEEGGDEGSEETEEQQ